MTAIQEIKTRYLLIVSVTTWLAIHLWFGDVLILHDSWKHIFPIVYAVAQNASCGSLPAWLGSVDNGSSTLIYTISFSLTQIVRVPLLYFWSCAHPEVIDAMYMYKAQIYLTYFLFSASMYVLGRVLFTHRIAAAYLCSATLFAGLCLDSAHSNQIVSELFWVPWILIASVLYHRNFESRRGVNFLNLATIFFCIQLLDHYPHLIVIGTAISLLIYAWFVPSAFRIAPSHFPRLWPALIVLVLTAAHLLIIKQSISEYSPSLRSDLIVNPNNFGETGFVQLTALIGGFLPNTFMAGFDVFGDSMAATLQHAFGKPMGRKFIFRLDTLLFFVGVIPALLAIAFAIGYKDRKIRKGWLIFATVCFLVSLQQSKLYMLMFHVPFFNVFRGYFLYIVFVVFAVLVMGAYALDQLIGSPKEEREALAKRAIIWFLAFTAVSALALVGLILGMPERIAFVHTLLAPLALDVVLLLAGIVAFRKLARASTPHLVSVLLVLGLVLPQAAYFAKSYHAVGLSVAEVYAGYGIERNDDTGPAVGAEGIVRKLCMKFAQCYLSASPTVSLQTDLEGTFLRNRNEPVFQKGLARPAVEALTGIAQPPVWLSVGTKTYSNGAELVHALNAASGNVINLLRSTTFVTVDDQKWTQQPDVDSVPSGRLLSINRSRDGLRAEYQSETPLFMNAAVNFSPYWRASVDGRPATLVRGNFGGMVAPVPAGRHIVQFEFSDPYHDFVIYSRYFLLIIAIFAAAGIIWIIRKKN